jgi:hypothetical protein
LLDEFKNLVIPSLFLVISRVVLPKSLKNFPLFSH